MQTTRTVTIRGVNIGSKHPLALIAGPCVIESEGVVRRIAGELKTIAAAAGMPLVFKASYDKANRSSLEGYRGPGLAAGLEILRGIRDEFDLPVLSDVHAVDQVQPAAQALDAIQLPAFLCRQTDLLTAAGRSGKPVNIKKGQFMSPGEMANAVRKVESGGTDQIFLTERGSSFGYNNLVVDMRSLQIMRETGCPVVFDGTHSVQQPGALGSASGGLREFVPLLCRAAVAAGVDALFLEVHHDPASALCDGPNMLPLAALPTLLKLLKQIDSLVRHH